MHDVGGNHARNSPPNKEEPNTEEILGDYVYTCEIEHKRKGRPTEEIINVRGEHIKKLQRLQKLMEERDLPRATPCPWEMRNVNGQRQW